MCFFLIMFVYNMICGKTNYRLTQNWFEANKEFFKKNYKKIGIREDILTKMLKKNKKGLLKYSCLEEKTKDKYKKKVRKIHLHKKKEEVKSVNPKKNKKTKVIILQHSINVFKFFAFKNNNVNSMIVNFEVK